MQLSCVDNRCYLDTSIEVLELDPCECLLPPTTKIATKPIIATTIIKKTLLLYSRKNRLSQYSCCAVRSFLSLALDESTFLPLTEILLLKLKEKDFFMQFVNYSKN